LSGLISPSLEEMSYVAQEMSRRRFDVPLLIGGATTSKVHTAVKIAPHYASPVIYVPDASRAVGVAGQLFSGARASFADGIKAEYAELRQLHEGRQSAARTGLAAARANRLMLDWSSYSPPRPAVGGPRSFADYDLGELVARIDWQPFFAAWELAGRFPDLLDDKIIGPAARSLYRDAQAMLKRAVRERWLTARAAIGFWPANADGDDIVLYTDETRRDEMARVHTLRQQMNKDGDGRHNLALADFVAPVESGRADYLGGFVVTAGIGLEARAQDFEAGQDDYNSILLKALGDRLAEAFAERMHERVRREFWGYAADENLDSAALIAEAYRGIRPAPGYPACPDHTEKRTLFGLLDAEAATGVRLTDSCAMWPTSSVAGFYFGHPKARYFGVGRIDRDQVADYAARKGMSVADVERWLAPNLAYDPAGKRAA
ncbi:MAG: vitamin B12 dependent-methionine synthase activation domain-containing protein, partial [Alphaproteobacteria bacterium]